MATQTKRRNKGTTKMAAPTKAAPKRASGGQARRLDKKTLQGIVARLRVRESTLAGEARSVSRAMGPCVACFLSTWVARRRIGRWSALGSDRRLKGTRGRKANEPLADDDDV